MNKIHRRIWNVSRGAYVVVSEAVRSCGKGGAGGGGTLLAAVLLGTGASALSQTLASNALPTGGQVTAGQAQISALGAQMLVQQSTQRAAINWQSFNVGSQAGVTFVQPDAQSVTLNRVVGNERSVIDGALSANGNVYILNANGVLFNRNAQVNVGGLVASTRDMSDADFMAGRSTFTGNSAGSIINLGTLQAADGGHVALLGQQVRNEGLIAARLGSVVLASGNKITLDFNGNSLVKATIDEGALDALVENRQAIRADGGLVLLTAKGLDEVMRSVVNNSGEVRAQTIANRGGKIYLLGGMDNDRIEVGGTLDASAPNGGDGGFIETSAAKVLTHGDLSVSTLSAKGRTGLWLIDPTDFTIDVGSASLTDSGIGSQTLQAALSNSDVTIQTVATGDEVGHIHINDQLSWSANKLTLEAHGDINVNAAVSVAGTGSLDVKSGFNGTTYDSTKMLRMKFSTDDSSGASFVGKINFSGDIASTGYASDGTSRLDINGESYRLITSLGSATDKNAAGNYTLQGIAHSSNASIRFALANDLDASSTASWNGGEGFFSIGEYFVSPFVGKFNGLGNAISNLGIARQYPGYPSYGAYGQGLFGHIDSGAVVSNVAILNVNINVGGTTYAGADAGALAGLTGYNARTSATPVVLAQILTSGDILNSGAAGGIVGTAYNTRIENSHAFTNIQTDLDAGEAGGITGSAYGLNISGVGVGAVTIKASQGVGGLVGNQRYGSNGGITLPTIENSYSFATVIGNVVGYGGPTGRTNQAIGGLAGSAVGTISNSFARGNVSALAPFAAGVAGFVGHTDGGNIALNINDSFSTGTVSVSGSVVAGVGNFFGEKRGSGLSPTIVNSYWDATLTGSTTASGYGDAAKTTAELKTFSNFSSLWDITEENFVSDGYPQLRWASSVAATGSVWVMSSPVIPVSYTLGTVTGLHVYNGNTVTLGSLWSAASIFGSSYSSWVLGTDYSFQYNGSTVTGFTAAGSYNGITVAISRSGYTLANSGNTAGGLIIAPKPLGLSASKVYDGSNALSGVQVTFTGLVGNETLAYTGAVANSQNAGTSNYISALTLVNGSNGGLASNYILPTLDASHAPATITPKALTVTGTTAADKTYDGSTAAQIQAGTLSGLVGSETLSVTASGAFGSANAGAQSASASYTLANGSNGGLASNYSLADTSGHAATITPKALTVTGTTAADKTYDGSTAAQIQAGTLSGLVGSETLSVTASGAFGSANAGAQSASASYTLANGSNGGLASNYSLADTSGHAATITPKALTVTGTTAADKTYDGSTAAQIQAGTLSGLVGSETLSVTASGAFGSANAGAQSASASYTLANGSNGGLASNYSLADTSGHAATITPKALTVTGTTAADKTYDGSTAAQIQAGTLSGLVGSETLSVTASGAFGSANAGAQSASASYTLANGSNGGLASNYSLADTSGHAATITPKALTVTGTTAADKTYDGSTAAQIQAGTLSGLVGSETLSVTASGAFGSANAGAQSASASYTLANGSNGGLASNYSLADTSGHAATITPKALTVTGTTAADKTYDGSTAAQIQVGALSGLVAGEATPSVLASGEFDSANPGTRVVNVRYSVANPNYFLAGQQLEAQIAQSPSIANVTAQIAKPSLLAVETGQLGGNTSEVLLPASFVVNTASKAASTAAPQPGMGNVVQMPSGVGVGAAISGLGANENLMVISSPKSDGPTAAVTLTQAQAMTSAPGAAAGTREVRVPVSRNSLAEIVNGGVRLPGGVEQQLFVVKK